MIISASRRTDIPANYSEWFFNRLSEGYVLVRNPMNPYQVGKIFLDPPHVDCFVFWTKFPAEFLKNVDLLKNYKYYFQFTVTPYSQDIEKNLPEKSRVILSFQELSAKIGSKRLIWRYDPIIFNRRGMTLDFHKKNFHSLCQKLHKYARKCVISFFDNYKFASFNSKGLEIIDLKENDMKQIASSFSEIGKEFNLEIETCAESIDLSAFGISHGKCVDNRMISEILGYDIEIEKDKSQREFCGCVKSVDIGTYSTCLNNCLYCYATKSNDFAIECFQRHNPKSPLLFGELGPKDRISVRKNESFQIHQPKLF